MEPRTFDIRSCRNLRNKLERELERFQRATSREDVVDHGMNFAVTAWHLVDWTWADTKHTTGLRQKLAREAGHRADRFGLREFRRFVLGEKSCRELGHCRIVATASKHLHFDPYPDDPDFVAGVAPAEVKWLNDRGEEVTWVNNKGESVTWTSSAWDLWIVEGSARRRAAEVFQRVLSFWSQFIYGNQIDERQEPLPT